MSGEQTGVCQLTPEFRQRLEQLSIFLKTIIDADTKSIRPVLEQAWCFGQPDRSEAVNLVFNLNPEAVTGCMLGQGNVMLVFA